MRTAAHPRYTGAVRPRRPHARAAALIAASLALHGASCGSPEPPRPAQPVAPAAEAAPAAEPAAEPAPAADGADDTDARDTADAADAAPTPGPAAPAARIRVVAVGDVLFGRYSESRQYLRVPVTKRPFAAVRPILASADVAFANLECPMLAEPRRFRTHRRLTFRAQPADAALLARAGFDVISIANNHARDFGLDAVPIGRRHLEAAGLAAIGGGAGPAEAARPAVITRNNVRIAFLAFTVWLKGDKSPTPTAAVAFVHNSDLVKRVTTAIERVRRSDTSPDAAPSATIDAIVVSLHWGWEPETAARPVQRAAARAIIDAGADVILGHHPHVFHEVERYRGGVIAYSLGNFMFDNPSLNQRLTAILDVTLERRGDATEIADVILHPVVIDARTRTPRPLRRGEHRRWLARLAELAPGATIARPTARRSP
jgi:poly-gamma-glutamate synthesis protein (capsule biosynthesis protein)